MKRRTDRTTTNLAHRLNHAADIIPTIRTHLNEQRAHLTTLRSSGGNHDTRPGSTHADPTVRLVLELQHIDTLEGYIDDALQSINVGINLFDEACRNALGHRTPDHLPPPPTEPVCYIAGCHDYVSSYRLANGQTNYRMGGDLGGLCDRHRSAARRGTLDHGSMGHQVNARKP